VTRRPIEHASVFEEAQHSTVIAELTFGFWRYLSIAAQHHPLWIP
jgi:hypothetical protein